MSSPQCTVRNEHVTVLDKSPNDFPCLKSFLGNLVKVVHFTKAGFHPQNMKLADREDYIEKKTEGQGE